MAKNIIKEAVDRQKKRREVSGCQIAISDSIDHLNLDQWMKIAGSDGLFHHPDYLRVLQTHPPAKVSHRFGMIHSADSEPMAAIVMQILDVNASDLITTDAKAIKKNALRGLKTRLLVLGNVIGGSASGIASCTDTDIWPAIWELLYRVRRAEKLSGNIDIMMVMDLDPTLRETSEQLKDYSYRPLDVGPDMVLEFEEDWNSFEDYLAGLNKKYRKSTKTIFSKVEKAGCTVESTADISQYADEIYAIYKQVEQQADVRLASLNRDYLPELAKSLGPERFRCTLIRRDDELLGFVTTLKDGDQAVGYYLGVNYEENAEVPLYFRLLAAVIEDAFALGCKRVSYGRTAEEPKARFGAKPVETEAWLRHRVPVVNVVFRQLLQLVTHEEPPVRNTFKKA